jgi:hypothetical protein
VAIEIRQKVGELGLIVQNLQKGLNSIPKLNANMSAMESEFLKTKETLREISAQRAAGSQELQTMKAGLLARDKEIMRLQGELEG